MEVLVESFEINYSFIEYNYMILDQINFNDEINYKIKGLEEEVDIFKNFIFKDLIDDSILYLYNFSSCTFYEIKFKFSICSYLVLLNYILVTLDYGKTTIKLILKLENSNLLINKDKLKDIPFILNMEQTLHIINNSNNYISISSIEDINIIDKTIRDNNTLINLILKSKSKNKNGFTVIDDRRQFNIKDNYINDIDLEREILDCFNLNKDELLVMLLSKNNTIKYYILNKNTYSYLKFKNMSEIIYYISNYYDVFNDSFVYDEK